jgi:hypothetical protein
LLGPPDYFRAKPEFDSALAEIENGPRHIAVALLILEHGVAVCKAENLGDAVRVEQVLCVDSWRHDLSLHR